MVREPWRGYFAALVTPFDDALEVDVGALGRYVSWLGDAGVHGLVVAGTLGEWPALSARDRAILLEAAVAARPEHTPVVMGCTDFTAARVLSRARAAAVGGADGILVAPPPYVRLSDREVRAFFREVASASPLPLCLYNWPPGTGLDLAPRTLADLAGLPAVVAVKNSTGDPARFAETLERIGGRAALFGVPLNADGLDLLAAGAAGTIGAAGVAAEHQVAFFEQAWRGARAEAAEAGRIDQALLTRWFTPGLTGRLGAAPAALKLALGVRGIPVGTVRPPLLELEADAAEQVRADLAELGLGRVR